MVVVDNLVWIDDDDDEEDRDREGEVDGGVDVLWTGGPIFGVVSGLIV